MKQSIVTLDVPNKNGRIYPRKVFEKAMAEYKKKFIDDQRAFVTKKLPERSVVNLIDVVGIINEMYIEDNKVMIDVTFFYNVPDGLMIETAIKDGHLHLRTSGMATLIKNDKGNYVVQDDYELIQCFATDRPA